MSRIERVILIVLDSVGAGELPDAADYGDVGSNTLGNIARELGGLSLPNMGELGLGHVTEIDGVPPIPLPRGAYGRMAEASRGKDTTVGHWEMAGVISEHPMPTYPQGFPESIMHAFEERIGRGTLGNTVASGTVIIQELGPEHMRTGKPIVYTSADSVFQIAAHEEVVPVEDLYRMCRIAREILVGPHAVGRVIARPFVGEPGAFVRTDRRKDFSAPPPGTTILDQITQAGKRVWAVGKIEDIFAGRGISDAVHTHDNMDGVDQTLRYLEHQGEGLVFTNLVDFDMRYGHRNNVRAYADALEAFDARMPELMAAMRDGDILVITADHGCDPTTPSTDHSREYVPLLVAGEPILPGVDLGIRPTFADLGATIVDWLQVEAIDAGESFAPLVTRPAWR